MGLNDVRAGKAYVEVYTKDNTRPGLTAVKNRLTALAGGFSRIPGIYKAAAAAATVSAPALALRSAVNFGGEIQDAAERTGLTAETVQEFGYAARQTATDVVELEAGMKVMQKNVAVGTKEFTETLAKLGIELEELRRLDPAAQFERIADAISKVGSPDDKVAFSMAIFGKAGQALIPILNLGAEGIKKLRDRARDLGLVLSNEEIAQLESFGDTIDELEQRFKMIEFRIGLALLPLAEELANALEDLIPVFRNLIGEANKLAQNAPNIQPGAGETLANWLEGGAEALDGFFGAVTGSSAMPFSSYVEDSVQGMRTGAQQRKNANESEQRFKEQTREQARREREARVQGMMNAATAAKTDAYKAKVTGTFYADQFAGQFGGRVLDAQLETQKKIEVNTRKRPGQVAPGLPVVGG